MADRPVAAAPLSTVRIFSGIQPTGRKHLGNYIGAIAQYVSSQERGEGIFCIVDLHALTVAYEPAELRERLYDTTAILLAAAAIGSLGSAWVIGGLAWALHVALDRALGYGLRTHDGFQRA